MATDLDLILAMEHQDFLKYNIRKTNRKIASRKRRAFEEAEAGGITNSFPIEEEEYPWAQ